MFSYIQGFVSNPSSMVYTPSWNKYRDFSYIICDWIYENRPYQAQEMKSILLLIIKPTLLHYLQIPST